MRRLWESKIRKDIARLLRAYPMAPKKGRTETLWAYKEVEELNTKETQRLLTLLKTLQNECGNPAFQRLLLSRDLITERGCTTITDLLDSCAKIS